MPRSRVWLAAVLCLALAFALVACSADQEEPTPRTPYGGSATETPSTGPTVTETGLSFEPATLEVSVGDTVTFTNEDSAPHNVSIAGEELGSQSQGESVTWKADTAGNFPYTCTIHPSMTGTIVVK